jgi:hypothetical protein
VKFLDFVSEENGIINRVDVGISMLKDQRTMDRYGK